MNKEKIMGGHNFICHKGKVCTCEFLYHILPMFLTISACTFILQLKLEMVLLSWDWPCVGLESGKVVHQCIWLFIDDLLIVQWTFQFLDWRITSWSNCYSWFCQEWDINLIHNIAIYLIYKLFRIFLSDRILR